MDFNIKKKNNYNLEYKAAGQPSPLNLSIERTDDRKVDMCCTIISSKPN